MPIIDRNKRQTIVSALEAIDPTVLTYQEWLSVGMALKYEGFTAADWDTWSRRDPDRYHPGECWHKWDSFQGSDTPITGGTIMQLARDQGWQPPSGDAGHELEWDAIIGSKDKPIVDAAWIEGQEIIEPGDEWDPVQDLITYLETLFEASENVGYVCESYESEKDSRMLPTKGCWDRTAGELIQQLRQCKGDIGSVLGDYKPDVGAWIRFNPLDGKGCKNENVTDFRYALVESDDTDIEHQYAIIRALELPVACLAHSGRKSLHAIVRIEAANYEEYRRRVDYLYAICKRNGLAIDTQNRNPSRLSRMPGVMRTGRKQFLVATNIGKTSWAEWYDWIEAVNDDLPEPESLTSVWDNLPDLSPPLIDGVLRQGHKMLLAGPSKSGKSYALIELCVAIAEGRQWFGWQCAQGRVMYVNLELDRASCLHRFKDVYTALGWQPDHLTNIDVWNLRGRSVPMDKLAPKLIRRAQKKGYIAVIIDPIYKVITGDENSADQMAHFCNQFDLVCHELNAAVIYCHHHSKGYQASKKSMDRPSGSGVFARDPDALLDLIELALPSSVIKRQEDIAIVPICAKYLEQYAPKAELTKDELCCTKGALEACERLLKPETYQQVLQKANSIKEAIRKRTAWRIEGTLREVERFEPVNLWFDYPIHNMDTEGLLKDVEAESEKPPWLRGTEKNQKRASDRRQERKEAVEAAFEACRIEGDVTLTAMAEYLGITEKTARRRIQEHGGFAINGGLVMKSRRTKP